MNNSDIYVSRIELLRTMMRERGWDAVIITSSDPHLSEYLAERWKQVEWLSGFTGEAADMVVTLDHAGLWTDTRYFIQATRQLEGTGVVLHKTRVPEQVLIPDWLRSNYKKELVVALDGLCVSAEFAMELPGTIVSVPDLLSSLWLDRPQIPQTPIVIVDTGVTMKEKLTWLRDVLKNRGCDAMLISSLDEIAWLLNIRASDIEYNPLCISYLLVTMDCVGWCVVKEEIEDSMTASVFLQLRAEGVEILHYSELDYLLGELEGSVLVDKSVLSYEVYSSLSQYVDLVEEDSPIALKKAVKTPKEQDDIRRIHIQDGVAVERFLYWLETAKASGRTINEWEAAVKLGHFRAEIQEYAGESFETISAYGDGAALPHYCTPREGAPVIGDNGLYLCDSGGQYICGTTDITRTVPVGACSVLEAEDYTLVLKGHIALARAVFPMGTAGCHLDALARSPLWSKQRNFGHGTGHGVGYFLGVHEGPHDIRQNYNATPLLPGMVVSDEPGIYREGKHGVRHENLLLCVDAGANEFGTWLAFEPLTLCHFDTSILLYNLLDRADIEWLNAYHEKVYTILSPYLDEDVRLWLRAKTAAI